MTETKFNPFTPLKRWLYDYAQRFTEAEYTGEVEPREPTTHLFISIVLWAVLALAGDLVLGAVFSGWVKTVLALVWLLVAGFLVRFGMARYHGLSVPEYSDYLEKRTDRYTERQDRERARELERNINQQIQELKDMEAVESVAVWGDGIDIELWERPTEDRENDE